MKIVYIAHPIGGDVEGNIQKIKGIIQQINRASKLITPFVPYLADVMFMNDNDEKQRRRGILNNKNHFKKRTFDELWVYGDKLSKGVKQEIQWAIDEEIPIVFKNGSTKAQLKQFFE